MDCGKATHICGSVSMCGAPFLSTGSKIPYVIIRYQIIILTHWGGATHICVAKLTTIGSDNGLSPGRRQAIIWTIAGILLIGPLETNFSEILIGIQTFSFKKMHLKMSSAKWRPSCLGLNVLINQTCITVNTTQQCRLAQRWSSVGNVVPMLGQG